MAYNNNTNARDQNLVVINSAFRLTPTTSTSGNFRYSINKNIPGVTALVLKYIQIPFTFYTINSVNNRLTFNGGAVTATIPVGNYTAQTITSALTTAINTAFGDTATTVLYNDLSFKLTITRGTPFIVDSVRDRPLSTAASSLGFYVSSVNSVTATGDSAINISGPNYININSNFLMRPARNQVSVANGIGGYNGTLFTVPNMVAPGEFMYFETDYKIEYGYKYDIKTTDIIDITVRDEFNNILDLNGVDIVIQLFMLAE